MCSVNEKLAVFDKLVSNIKQRTGYELDKMSNTYLMKVLFLTCVASVNNDGLGLFGVFKSFYAFQHGPVEIDIYYNIKKYRKNPEIYGKRTNYDDNVNCAFNALCKYDNILYNIDHVGNDNSLSNLINATHRSSIWGNALLTASGEMHIDQNTMLFEKEYILGGAA